MVWKDNATNTEKYLPLLCGEEHGPFWEYNTDTGAPTLRQDTSVVYPVHRWEAGSKDPKASSHQQFDVWLAFELPVALSTVFEHN